MAIKKPKPKPKPKPKFVCGFCDVLCCVVSGGGGGGKGQSGARKRGWKEKKNNTPKKLYKPNRPTDTSTGRPPARSHHPSRDISRDSEDQNERVVRARACVCEYQDREVTKRVVKGKKEEKRENRE